MSRDPQTPAEWQEAADEAHFLLGIHSAVLYGLITGPEINAGRCHELLERAAKMGVQPAPDAAGRLLARSMSGRPRRAGRTCMPPDERQRVSARMTEYWALRRKAEAKGEGA